ncbi:MAG TPA: hypothetical protein VGC21_20200 [Telluria sp.]|jgi:hypothetical protein
MTNLHPSTVALLRTLGADWSARAAPDGADDARAIQTALRAWENRLYHVLPAASRDSATWPAAPELLAALRASLADQRATPAGAYLAYCLVRCGCRDSATIDGLCAWDAQLFRWQAAGYSARDLLAKFNAIGMAGQPGADALDRFDARLADPGAALAEYGSSHCAGTLLQGRWFVASLCDNDGCPNYAGLLTSIANRALLPITAVTQESTESAFAHLADSDYGALVERFQAEIDTWVPKKIQHAYLFSEPETWWQISFAFAGAPEHMIVPGDWSWVNDAGLALRCDAILARLGRPERVLKFGPGRNEGESAGAYVVARPEAFAGVCAELGIPLSDFTGILHT